MRGADTVVRAGYVKWQCSVRFLGGRIEARPSNSQNYFSKPVFISGEVTAAAKAGSLCVPQRHG
ncbi:MAG: hypothetical protein DMG70_29115 [Acidobacteria bacterium]|nr:MAG: hypothetical protein DMG70_29115 [Acidobacteriota bacterium]